ncbi:MAG: phosphoadenylyl-sulfate reductase [Planctomycetaceae bacterium]
MARLTQAELDDLNKTFEQRTPQELIVWAKSIFDERLAAMSSMQRSGSVICHMLAEMRMDVPVLFVDTGVLFQETLDTRDEFIRRYGLNIITLQPDLTMAEQTKQHGVLYLTVEGQEQCCHRRKTEPLMKVKGKYDGLISSLRRSDGGQRARTPILSVDPPMNALRINPLVNFSDEELKDYIRRHDVYINPLHFQGYATIGCNRCTTPVLESEPKRAGRWRHLGPWSQYCGINPTDVDGGTVESIDLPLELIDRILGRETDFMI